jgi:hypothetical protein
LPGKPIPTIVLLGAAWLAGCGAPASPRPAASTPATSTPAARAAPAEGRGPATDAGDKAARGLAKAAGGLRDISFDDVKLEMQKGDPFSRDLLPERVTALENTRVRIRGYILPSFQQTGLTQFVLVRDNMECCFGPGAALHDCVVVRMLPGKTAAFSIRPVAVTGRFRVEELRGPDGRHLAIYAMDGEQVQ